MNRLLIEVGIDFDAIERDMLDAVARAARGEHVAAERRISFENWPAFFKVMTPNRVAVLETVAVNAPRSVRALAQALGRDHRRVQQDVAALLAAGLLERDDDGRLRTEAAVDQATIVAA